MITLLFIVVGYGDIFPKTPTGQFIGVLCMITGIVLITLPVAVIGLNYSNCHDAMDMSLREKAKRKAKRQRASQTKKQRSVRL